MKMNIYLPDDLHERVKAVEDLNVSAICQAALEAELLRRSGLGPTTPAEDLALVDDDSDPVRARAAVARLRCWLDERETALRRWPMRAESA
jgi:hypothetical protein